MTGPDPGSEDPRRVLRIGQCTDESCRFRFPLLAAEPPAKCPRCRAPVRVTAHPFGGPHAPVPAPGGIVLDALLDNLRSVHNVGSIFRSADGAGVGHLHLCGITPTPAHPRLAKAALGAHKTVTWSAHANAVDAARALRAEGRRLWAVETGTNAEPLLAAADRSGPPVVLVVGNEKSGVDPEVLALCDRVLALPMAGHKISLNVAVAFGIAAYVLRFGAGAMPGP